MKTTISGSPDELVRARYTVTQPNFIAVGDNSIYVSENGNYWMSRSNIDDFPSFDNLNAIYFWNEKYIIVGANGTILTSQAQKPWIYSKISTYDLNGITWSNHYNKFFVVGDMGTIYSSNNGLTWSKITANTSNNLFDITAIDELLVAVGDNNTIIYSNNGSTWSAVSLELETPDKLTSIALNIIDENNKQFIAVGSSGIILSSEDGLTWQTNELNDINSLNAVHHSGNIYMAVGNNGLLVTSNNGIDWNVVETGVTADLYGVFAIGSIYIAVGDDRTILYSTNGTDWVSYTTINNDHLKAIYGRCCHIV